MKDSFSSGYLRYYERYRHGSFAVVVIKKQGARSGSSSWRRGGLEVESGNERWEELWAGFGDVRPRTPTLIALWLWMVRYRLVAPEA